MLVHRCDRCCVYKKEIQPCRTKYRGIWAILMHKMMFPSESCNSVSNGTFCEFRPFSVIAEIFSQRTTWTTSRTPGGTRTPVWEPMLYCYMLLWLNLNASSNNTYFFHYTNYLIKYSLLTTWTKCYFKLKCNRIVITSRKHPHSVRFFVKGSFPVPQIPGNTCSSATWLNLRQIC